MCTYNLKKGTQIKRKGKLESDVNKPCVYDHFGSLSKEK